MGRRLNVWSMCDRCGMNYYAHKMREESTGVLACEDCYDGAYDIQNHPQNKPIRPRLESKKVPDGRPMENLDQYLAKEDTGFLLTEDGYYILVTGAVWTPSMSSP